MSKKFHYIPAVYVPMGNGCANTCRTGWVLVQVGVEFFEDRVWVDDIYARKIYVHKREFLVSGHRQGLVVCRI